MDIWQITIKAPMGDIEARLEVSDADGTPVAAMSGKSGSGPAENLSWTQDKVAWSTKIQKPMPMTLKFKGRIEGDTMSGKVAFGVFASGTFVGQRVTAG